jgi:hypothetical protein
LSATDEEAAAALELFDARQVSELAQQCAALIERLGPRGLDLTSPRRRLGLLLARVGADPAPRH